MNRFRSYVGMMYANTMMYVRTVFMYGYPTVREE